MHSLKPLKGAQKKDHLVIRTIAPDPAKIAQDIDMPTLTPILVRKKTLAEEISGLEVASLQCSPFPMKAGTEESRNFRYEGYDVNRPYDWGLAETLIASGEAVLPAVEKPNN